MATAALRVRVGLIPAGIRSRASAEEREEREAARRRGEEFARGQGLGRLFGGAGGLALAALLAPITGGGSLALAGLVGAGSFAGQVVATKKSRRRQVDAGTFFREQGLEREKSFRRQTALSQLAAQGGLDALAAFQVSKSLGSLSNLFGSKPSFDLKSLLGPAEALTIPQKTSIFSGQLQSTLDRLQATQFGGLPTFTDIPLGGR